MARTDAEPRLGNYTPEQARDTPYLTERMGAAIALALAVAEVFPDAPPMIEQLRVEEWPAERARAPESDTYRIRATYNDAFASLLHECTRAQSQRDARALRALSHKTTDELRDRYWALTDELDRAQRNGEQANVVALGAERDVLARMIAGKGEAIGHSGDATPPPIAPIERVRP